MSGAHAVGLQRRQWLERAALWAALPALGLGADLLRAHAQSPARVVKLVAQRFHFSPSEIALRAGEAITLEIRSLDFIHGLLIPDLKLRADLPPGRVTTLLLKFDKPGAYDFLCDNFCGSEHDEMSGKFIVT
jgi:cytochrome c oxidase subunit II